MLEFPKSPLEWAQFLTSRLIAAAATKGYREALDEFTEIDTDGTIATATTFVAGELTAASVQKQSDDAVEKVWNWVAKKKAERAQKKNADKE